MQISAFIMHLYLLQGSNYNFLSKIVNTVTINDATMNTVTIDRLGYCIDKEGYILIRIQKYGEIVD